MAKLTEEQAKTLAELQALAEAPDEPEGNGLQRILNVTVDLGDEAQVERARSLGFLPPAEAPAGGGEEEEKPPAEEDPKRRGFFND